MQTWVKLTPEERRAARERYKKMAKLPQDKQQDLKLKWEEYNRLPEQERRKLGSPPRKPPPAPLASKSPGEPTPLAGAPSAPPESGAPTVPTPAAGPATQ
jgi:hypothetical protein